MPEQNKLEAINNLEKGNSKTVEWIVNILNTESKDGLGVRYGRLTFKKSLDGKYVDCKLFIYKLDFTLVPNMLSSDNSILYGLYKLSNSEIERGNTKNEITRLQNYIRHKALLEFEKEGFINPDKQKENYLN